MNQIDAIIVLRGDVDERGTAPHAVARRVREAVRLQLEGVATRIIMSGNGGIGHRSRRLGPRRQP